MLRYSAKTRISPGGTSSRLRHSWVSCRTVPVVAVADHHVEGAFTSNVGEDVPALESVNESQQRALSALVILVRPAARGVEELVRGAVPLTDVVDGADDALVRRRDVTEGRQRHSPPTTGG
jgi:hypothetical protein